MEVGGIKVYSVGRGPKAVVVLREIYGWEGRLKPVCDTLAEPLGCHVVMPDLHAGETAHGMSDVSYL